MICHAVEWLGGDNCVGYLSLIMTALFLPCTVIQRGEASSKVNIELCYRVLKFASLWNSHRVAPTRGPTLSCFLPPASCGAACVWLSLTCTVVAVGLDFVPKAFNSCGCFFRCSLLTSLSSCSMARLWNFHHNRGTIWYARGGYSAIFQLQLIAEDDAATLVANFLIGAQIIKWPFGSWAC